MSIENRSGQRARREILDAAIGAFAVDGFGATSVQHIADASGHSKSSVLYHFDSKEKMLDAALTPAIDALEELLAHWSPSGSAAHAPRELVTAYVDFLLQYRGEASIILIQGQSLGGLSVMQRANALIAQLADAICAATPDVRQRMRVGVGLAGAAYVLGIGESLTTDANPQPDDVVRDALLTVLAELFSVER